MKASSIQGIWTEELSPDLSVRFDTQRKPERISVQKQGENPTHLDYEDGITIEEVLRVISITRKAYNL